MKIHFVAKGHMITTLECIILYTELLLRKSVVKEMVDGLLTIHDVFIHYESSDNLYDIESQL